MQVSGPEEVSPASCLLGSDKDEENIAPFPSSLTSYGRQESQGSYAGELAITGHVGDEALHLAWIAE